MSLENLQLLVPYDGGNKNFGNLGLFGKIQGVCRELYEIPQEPKKKINIKFDEIPNIPESNSFNIFYNGPILVPKTTFNKEAKCGLFCFSEINDLKRKFGIFTDGILVNLHKCEVISLILNISTPLNWLLNKLSHDNVKTFEYMSIYNRILSDPFSWFDFIQIISSYPINAIIIKNKSGILFVNNKVKITHAFKFNNTKDLDYCGIVSKEQWDKIIINN